MLRTYGQLKGPLTLNPQAVLDSDTDRPPWAQVWRPPCASATDPGGMGAGVSSWGLAREVSSLGQLGVVSGTALDSILVRKLWDGDPGGHMRRAIAAFPVRRPSRRPSWIATSASSGDAEPDRRASATSWPRCCAPS